MKKCLERAEERIQWLLELEVSPFSLNTHYLADYKAKFLAHYKSSRDEHNRAHLATAIRDYELESQAKARQSKKGTVSSFSTPAEPIGIAKILSGLAEIGMTGIKPEGLANLLPPDRMEPALIIMADVRAYFQGPSVCQSSF
jgi:hypothetical protein